MRFCLTLVGLIALAGPLAAQWRRHHPAPACPPPVAVPTPAPAAWAGPVPTPAPAVAGPAKWQPTAVDALDEVNALRTARGLRPYVRDEGLTLGAVHCAAFRAERLMFGHVTDSGLGDKRFLLPGATAAATGCAAYPASFGWMSCCVYDRYTYAGAAWVFGPDGKRYMSLFVR